MTKYSESCREILSLMKARKNVLISGPPGTGKTTLLAEVAHAFQDLPTPASPAASRPVIRPGSKVIPSGMTATKSDSAEHELTLPAANRSKRKVFQTVFHQNMKYRDFVSGIIPSLKTPGQFDVSEGLLLKASEFAKQSDGASLLIIDEINRGPAVQIFGGSIVAMEWDKRLNPDNSPRPTTQFFELLHPSTGNQEPYAFPAHLYILAAMNQADVSVDALDVAFLRRWAPHRLVPSESALRDHLSLGKRSVLPETPTSVADVYEALVQAWAMVNERIALGRGPEFQIGHGMIMSVATPSAPDLPTALAHLIASWNLILAHLEEVFFADIRGVAAALNASEGSGGDGYVLANMSFAGEPRNILRRPDIQKDKVYKLLRSVIG